MALTRHTLVRRIRPDNCGTELDRQSRGSNRWRRLNNSRFSYISLKAKMIRFQLCLLKVISKTLSRQLIPLQQQLIVLSVLYMPQAIYEFLRAWTWRTIIWSTASCVTVESLLARLTVIALGAVFAQLR